MRKVTRVLALLAMVLGMTFGLATSASAADNVHPRAGSAPYQLVFTNDNNGVYIDMRWDNTNCDANSTNNCSGANGAQQIYIDVTADHGYLFADKGNVGYDIWGDGLTCRAQNFPVTWHRYSNIHIRWTAAASAIHVRRTRVIVLTGSSSSDSTPGVVTSNMLNPFNYSEDDNGDC